MWEILEAQELGTNKPVPLRKISPELAQAAIVGGHKDGEKSGQNADQVASVKIGDSVPVAKLSPMQKEVIPEKALGMAIGNLLKGKPNLEDMQAIVSSDNYIMDGHHRWAAATLIDPNKMVRVARVGIPATQLVTALNIWTKAKGRDGNPGKGDISQFVSTINKKIDEMIANFNNPDYKAIPDQIDKNTGNTIPGISIEEAKQAFAKLGNGDPVAGANKMKENSTMLPTQRHPLAPERVDMPVVEGAAEISDVVKKLMAGDIDWNLPLSPETQSAKGGVTNTQNMQPNQPNQKNLQNKTTNQTQVKPQQNATKPVQNVGKQFGVTPNQQRQVASTQYDQPSINEWLVLSGIKNNLTHIY